MRDENDSRPLLLMSANSAWNIRNFRMEVVRSLQGAGYRVAVAAPPGDDALVLERSGVQFLPLPMRASGTSPIHDFLLFVRFLLLLRRMRPAAFLGFTPKPNVYGSMAARLCGVPAINNVTGLGTAFIQGKVLERLVSTLYRIALSRSRAIFFHNPDDRALFIGRGMVPPERAKVIPGSGVDLDKFAPAPPTAAPGDHVFLFVGRLLWEKGVGEFAEAARALKRVYPEARFQILGSFAEDGRAVPRELVERWQAEGSIEYLGTAPDIRSYVSASDCVVLPSYREGLPRVLLEAAAMARPAVASDVPGCRHVVDHGVTGFLCEARSAEALTGAVRRMIELPPEQRRAMGLKARERAEEQFGVERVCTEYLTVLEQIRAASLAGRGRSPAQAQAGDTK